MKHFKYLFVAIIVISFYGCAAVKPDIGVKKEFWDNKNSTVGVALVKLPEPMTHKAGNQGLLDLAINNANASDLDIALQKQDISSINQVQDKIVTYLTSRGLKAKKITTPIDIDTLVETETSDDGSKGVYYAKRDFKPLKKSLGVDKLVMIHVTMIGTIRNYYGFIPTGSPSGYAVINGSVVNLDNNQLEWNQLVTQSVPFSGADWDTPPEFTALVKAMDTAYKQSQTMLLNTFVQ